MNKNSIVEFKTKKVKGLFISVPYTTKPEECFFKDKESLQFVLMCAYGRNELDFIPIVIPEGDYKIIGLSHSMDKNQVSENLGIEFKEYIRILNTQDISINYSDTSNFWLVVTIQ